MKYIFGVVFLTACNSYYASDADVGKIGPVVSYSNNGQDFTNLTGTGTRMVKSQAAFRKNAFNSVYNQLLIAANASLLSYENEVSDPEWARYTIDRPKALLGSSKTILIVRVNDADKVIEIAVRGTASLDDALKDLNAKLAAENKIHIPIHSGFLTVSNGIVDFIENKFSDVKYKDYKYKFYGHSLGGAVANIVAMHLHDSGRTVELVATFGAPRFTTNEGARKYQVLNQVTYRIVRCDDVVPFLPPPNFWGWTSNSYETGGNLLLLLKPPFFDYSIGVDIERDFMQQLRIELNSPLNHDKLANGHRMGNYLARLQAYSNNPAGNAAPGLFSIPVYYEKSLQNKVCTDK